MKMGTPITMAWIWSVSLCDIAEDSKYQQVWQCHTWVSKMIQKIFTHAYFYVNSYVSFHYAINPSMKSSEALRWNNLDSLWLYHNILLRSNLKWHLAVNCLPSSSRTPNLLKTEPSTKICFVMIALGQKYQRCQQETSNVNPMTFHSHFTHFY